jgi:hypothetical protein
MSNKLFKSKPKPSVPVTPDDVLSTNEWRVFRALSLDQYIKHRAKRGLPPLTKWQHEQLTAQRLVDMVLEEKK